MPATIHSVAREAGVSTATVSNVLNRTGRSEVKHIDLFYRQSNGSDTFPTYAADCGAPITGPNQSKKNS